MSEAETIGEALDLSEIRLEMPGYVELVLSLVIVWGFGDAVSTLVAAAFAGPSLEANPWIRLLLVHHPLLVVALKAAVALYAGVVLLECRPVVERVPGWRAWFLAVIGLGTAVVVTNVYVGLAAVAAV
ncbi:hypothetical protein [Halosimplex halobium]|uniref:hypothetical protein n=1 Tax=Halosimplex halobium TaxID=3396618 RepID=UPI003F57A911